MAVTVDDGVFVEVLLEVVVADAVAVFDVLDVDVLDDVEELVEEAVEVPVADEVAVFDELDVEVTEDVGVCDQEGDKDGIVPYPTSIEHEPLDTPVCTVEEK